MIIMKYVRYKISDDEFIGILENDTIYRLDYKSILEAIDDEENIKENYLNCTQDNLDDIKYLSPTDPSKVVCIGLNYRDHADELKMQLPTEPLLFMKASSSVVANEDDVYYPSISNKVDYEAELAVVILEKIDMGSYNDNVKIAYSILNDVTARDLQEKDGQWIRSKNFDTFCPIGPVISTNIDASNLDITLKVNDEIRQKSNTKNMIFSPLELVEYISNVMTLNAGDVIATGTPPGVGQLNVEDVVSIEIEDIGVLRNFIKE